MIRRAKFVAIVLLALGSVLALLPDRPHQVPENLFLIQAIDCHVEFRPGLAATLLGTYNVFSVAASCEKDDNALST